MNSTEAASQTDPGNLLGNSLEIAISGAMYLSTVTKDDGLFKYRVSPITNKTLKGYNVLRHCGATWTLLDVYQKTLCSSKVLEAAERSLGRMYDDYFKTYRGLEQLCVISETKNMIKTGGAGLAILALCTYYEIKKDNYALETAKKIGDFVLSLFKDDGDLVHRLYYDTGEEFLGNEKMTKRCEFYPGEVLFGLVRLYEVTGDDKWLNTVLKNKFHLDGHYGVPEKNHWMLYTLKHLFNIEKTERIFTHAKRIAESTIEASPRNREIGNACGIATFTEGLLCFLDIASRSSFAFGSGLRQRLIECIQSNLIFQLQYRRPEGSFLLSEKQKLMRIDAVQHNVSCYMYYTDCVSKGFV